MDDLLVLPIIEKAVTKKMALCLLYNFIYYFY